MNLLYRKGTHKSNVNFISQHTKRLPDSNQRDLMDVPHLINVLTNGLLFFDKERVRNLREVSNFYNEQLYPLTLYLYYWNLSC